LIIDAHPDIGRGLSALLGLMPEVEVCGVAACGADGLARADVSAPDVALVEADLPDGDGTSVIRLIRARRLARLVVALGTYPERRTTALAAGADAFLLKDAGFEALRAAIGGGASDQHGTSVGTERAERSPHA